MLERIINRTLRDISRQDIQRPSIPGSELSGVVNKHYSFYHKIIYVQELDIYH